MKLLISTVLSVILIVMFFSCSNDGGVSSEKRKVATVYTDLHRYSGSESGARLLKEEGQELDQDSLYRALVQLKYFPKYAQTFKSANDIRFEFMEDGDMLSYTDVNNNKIILSTYEFVEDELFVLKDRDPDQKIFVAVRDIENKETYTRILTSFSYISKVENTETKELQTVRKDTLLENKLDIESALKLAGFEKESDMTNPNDTVMWCNVKYIFQ